jgi:Mg-chelatase subunit ChlD
MLIFLAQGRSGARLIGVAVVALSLAAALVSPPSIGGQYLTESLVFVTEDAALPFPGCDAISAHSAETGARLSAAAMRPSPGRLTGNVDLSLVLAGSTQNWGLRDGRIYEVRLVGDEWSNRWISGLSLAPIGGIAILDDEDTVLAATAGWPDSAPELPSIIVAPQAPFGVSKVLWSEVTATTHAVIGAVHGTFETESIVAEVMPAASRKAHLLTSEMVVHTIDADSMREAESPIQLPAFRWELGVWPAPNRSDAVYSYMSGVIHADLSADHRYLLSGRGQGDEIIVADLQTREAWSVALGEDVRYVGGIAWNKARLNRDLVAVHTAESVRLLRLAPDLRSVTEHLASLDLCAPLQPMSLPGGELIFMSGPSLSVAWTADGSAVVAAGTSDQCRAAEVGVPDEEEFSVLSVEEDGRRVEVRLELDVCQPGARNRLVGPFPNDILTANGRLAPTPSPTSTAPPTPTAKLSTPTPSATISPTIPLGPSKIYLPLVLREECNPQLETVDVVLVLDASTSMLERIRSDTSKLDLARAAARQFIALLKAGDQVALVSFNANAVVVQTLTGDFRAASERLDDIFAAQSTRLDLGIQEGQIQLSSNRRVQANRPVMIVLTDGRANPVPVERAITEAVAAKAAGTTVFAIGHGHEEDLDVDALRAIASRPAYFYLTPNADDLSGIYEEIAGLIPCPPERFWGGRVSAWDRSIGSSAAEW